MGNVLKKILTFCAVAAAVICLGFIAGPQNTKAAYPLKIRINKQQNCVTIYKLNNKGKYKPYKAMLCSVGWDTPLGNFSIKDKIRWHELEGPVYGQYCSRITGHILFHSVWYYENQNPATLSYAQYNKLGTVASHGCVRLNVRDAKWIYTYCGFGTPIEIYNSKNPGPLGKPAGLKLSGYTGWDPTDETNPANPYNKKKPSIKLVGSKNILYNSKFKLLDTIKATNTTGFDAVKRVSYTIKYKQAGKAARKVKKINTKKTGVYTVKFKLVDEMGRKAKRTVKYRVRSKIMLSSFTLNKSSANLYIGGASKYRKCTLSMKNTVPENASVKTLVFSSSNEAVATVSSKGVVKAVAPGTAVITAASTDGSQVVAKCNINVMKFAKSFTVSADKVPLNVGETARLTSMLEPADATGKKNLYYTYVSSDTNIAVVDAGGNVTAISGGTAVITVNAYNAAADKAVLTSQITVTVNPNTTDVSSSALTIN